MSSIPNRRVTPTVLKALKRNTQHHCNADSVRESEIRRLSVASRFRSEGLGITCITRLIQKDPNSWRDPFGMIPDIRASTVILSARSSLSHSSSSNSRPKLQIEDGVKSEKESSSKASFIKIHASDSTPSNVSHVCNLFHRVHTIRVGVIELAPEVLLLTRSSLRKSFSLSAHSYYPQRPNVSQHPGGTVVSSVAPQFEP